MKSTVRYLLQYKKKKKSEWKKIKNEDFFFYIFKVKFLILNWSQEKSELTYTWTLKGT